MMHKVVDKRRSPSRHFEKLRGELLADIAGDGDVTRLRTADICLAESAALLILRLETLRDEMLSGAACSDERLVRIVNSASRALNTLRSKRPKKAKHSLRDHLAARAAAKMDLSDDGDSDHDH
jgi:hypothetical protein